MMLFTLSPAGLQEMLTFLSDTALPLGLRLAPQKCELICFHRPGTVTRNTLPVVKLGDYIVPWKSSVIYLGSLFTEDGSTLAAIKHRICCAEAIVKRLNPRVFRRRAVSNKVKGQIHQHSNICFPPVWLTVLRCWKARASLPRRILPSPCQACNAASM